MTAARLVPKPLIDHNPKHDVAILALGSSDGAVREARVRLAASGIHTNYLRLRGFPFSEEVEPFIQAHRLVFVVEQNRDAQLRSLLLTETGVDRARLRSILHYNGMPIPASYVVDGVAAVISPARPTAQLVRMEAP
jgi:2-oxoglutarate/2-oxoacid ferredoxin oxidoreductase subunit alpha